jgi:hypothetical protein
MGKKDLPKSKAKPRKKLRISEEALRKIVDEEDALAPSSMVKTVRNPGDPGAPPEGP